MRERYEKIRYEYTYEARLIQADRTVKERYIAVKNELLAYSGVRCRMTKRGETFALGRKTIARLAMRGKTLCLSLALDPSAYDGGKYAVERVNNSSTPCRYKLRSARRVKYAAELIADAFDGLAKKDPEYIELDFYLPYEGVYSLMRRGAVKRKIISGEKDIEIT